MNYQGNIDAFYSYANENRKVGLVTRKRVYSGVLLFLLLGFLVWAYFNIFHWGDEQKSVETNKVEQREGLDALTFGKNSKIETLEKEQKMLAAKELENSKNNEKSVNASLQEREIKKDNNIKEKIATLVMPMTVTKANELNGSSMAMQTTQASQQLMGTAIQLVENNLSVANKMVDKNVIVTASEVIDANISTLNKSVNIDTNGTTTADSNIVLNEPKVPMQLYHLYIVQKGETLYDIARKQYNDTSMYVEIINANPDFENPDDIKVGQEILLPIVDESKTYSQILNFK